MSIERVDATTAPSRPMGVPSAVAVRRRTGDANLFLTWIDPLITGSLVTPSGLAVGNAGRGAARSLVVDVPAGPRSTADRLRRNGRIVIASLQQPGTVAAVVATGTVFVDWTDSRGERRSTWLRVPPLPSRLLPTA